ncbi:MAG: hypothetical protein ACRD0P_17975, partial [Stackebrandtia sp.]
MIENYLHGYLHKARAAELHAAADTWRQANQVPSRPDKPEASATNSNWWRRLLPTFLRNPRAGDRTHPDDTVP